MRQKLTLITLGVADIGRAEAFYVGLGWQKSPQSMDDLILFDLGGIVFSLYLRTELAADIGIDAAGSGFGGMTIAHNAQSKEEVDAVLAQVVPLGGTLVKPAQEVFWGGYSGYFRDLDGHLFEVAYNPFWPLDAAGNVTLG
jgi:predicted lactoylglutathione lyase